MAISITRLAEAGVAFLIVEGAGIAATGSAITGVTLAIAAAGMVYNQGATVDEIKLVLADIETLLGQTPAPSTPSTPSAPVTPPALPAFNVAAAKAAGYQVFINSSEPSGYVLFIAGQWYDVAGTPLGTAQPPNTGTQV